MIIIDNNNNIDSVVSQQAIEVTIGIFMTLTVIAYLAVAVHLVIVVLILYWGILVVSNL